MCQDACEWTAEPCAIANLQYFTAQWCSVQKGIFSLEVITEQKQGCTLSVIWISWGVQAVNPYYTCGIYSMRLAITREPGSH